ncbi:MAG TPA: glycosyltransferase family 39 protein [Acidimicrobiales bacterium]|nr:glycosyltransferase family 39 protein [Acidimicrobiales bacterium]
MVDHRIPPEDEQITPFAWGRVGTVTAVMGVVHLAVAGRYGWHRDEFYYLAAGRHLAWGYVDQPPLTPVLARLAGALPGGVWPLRMVAIAAQLGCIVLGAALARELGGARRAQFLAALVLAACPIFVGASLLLGTTGIDQLFWAATFVAVARALRRGDLGAWVVAGIVAGVGLENKHSLAMLLIGVIVGLAVTRRAELQRPGPWVMGIVAGLLWLPNLAWNATNDWPALKMASSISDDQGGFVGSLAQAPLFVLLVGPLLIPVWAAGLRWLLRPEHRRHAWLIVVLVVALVLTVAGGGKPYYPAPALIGLLVAGAVAIEALLDDARPLWRSGWSRLLGLSVVSSLIIGLPILGPSFATAIRPINQEPMETYGWRGFAEQVAAAGRGMPAGTVVLTGNYGEAGALEMFGPEAGLTFPVTSAHNSWATWGMPRAGTPESVLAVSLGGADRLRSAWRHVEPVGRITLPDGLVDRETDGDATIYRCTDPRGTWRELWPRLTHIG